MDRLGASRYPETAWEFAGAADTAVDRAIHRFTDPV